MVRGCRSLPSLPHSSSAVPRMSCHDEGMQVAPVTPTLIQCSTTHVLPWRGDAGRSRHSHTHPVQYHACPAMARGCRSLPSLPHSSSAVLRFSWWAELDHFFNALFITVFTRIVFCKLQKTMHLFITKNIALL